MQYFFLPAVLVVLFSSLLNVASAQIPGLLPTKSYSFDGYINYMVTAVIPEQSDNSVEHLIHNRLNLEYRFTDNWRFNTSMRNRFFVGDSAKSTQYVDAIGDDTGYFNLSENWADNSNAFANTTFDRLYLDWNKGDYQIRAGRFRINWGMTTIWNPNDVFNSYSIYDVDYPERSGVDAIYTTKKLDFASEVNFAFSPNKNSDLNSYSARYLFNVDGWDGQVIAGKSNHDAIIGFGVSGDVKGAALRGEMTWFRPTKDKWLPDDGEQVELESTVVSSIELSYSIASKCIGSNRNWLYTLALLHISNPEESLNARIYFDNSLTARTLSFTEFTGYADVSVDITPLIRLTALGSYYQDGSYFYGLTSNYSMPDNWQLTFVFQHFDGKNDSLFSEMVNTAVYVNIGWHF
jgi:hypothetical protein